ncbi:MAG: IS1182 family transposase [Chitinophagales bacterium]
MQGQKKYQEKLFVEFRLSDRVPSDNFYRRMLEGLDLSFLYNETAAYYGTEGQVSIDPVVFFKLLLFGYLENLNSDRRIIDAASMRLDVLFFLQYDIDEPLPWHSTLSRTRQLFGEEVFLLLFRKVLSMCVQAGMVKGKRLAVDSALVKANASLDSLVEKEVLEDAAEYIDALNEQHETTVSADRKKGVDKHHAWKQKEYSHQPGGPNKSGHTNKIDQDDEHGNLVRPKYLSNHTHYSPVDPDARIAVKPGKARQMNYFAQLSVDDAGHVITGACADHADKRDSQCFAGIMDQTITNLKQHSISVQQVAADTAYSSGESLRYCQTQNLDAWIPNFGHYTPERDGFIYNPAKDQYECIRGKAAILSFKGIKTDSKGYSKRTYRSSESVCKNCPYRIPCCGKKTKFKKIDDSVDKPYYDSMHQKITSNPGYAKWMMRMRSKTVEPVLGTLINFTNMRRINTRGISQANKHILMAALTYNLRKYMNYIRKNSKTGAAVLQVKPAIALQNVLFALFGATQTLQT